VSFPAACSYSSTFSPLVFVVAVADWPPRRRDRASPPLRAPRAALRVAPRAAAARPAAARSRGPQPRRLAPPPPPAGPERPRAAAVLRLRRCEPRRARRPRRAAWAAGGPGHAAGEPRAGLDAAAAAVQAATPAMALARGRTEEGVAAGLAPTAMWGPAVSSPLMFFLFFILAADSKNP
jgi:hypothetical protein